MASTRQIASAKMWIAALGVFVVILGASAGLMTQVFATTKDFNALKIDMAQRSGDARLRDWKLQTLQVQLQNMAIRQERTDENLLRLLERFRVTPAAEPEFTPLPPQPFPR